MLLPRSNSKPNKQVNQEYCLIEHVHMSKIKEVQNKEQNIQKIYLHLGSAPLGFLAVLELGVLSAGTFRLVACNESTRSHNYVYP